MAKKIRWGIISTAKIAREHVIPAIQKSKDSELVAIASRSISSAKKWAKTLDIPVAYGSYEELFNDPSIDAVYNPLPNHLHVPVSLQAAKAGKHVICEKPAALNEKEARQLSKIPKGVHYMEGFMVRFHNQWQEARSIVKSKKLGEVQAIQVFFSYFNRDAKNIRNFQDMGGGGIYDIGCYPMVVGKYIFGTKPKRVIGLADMDPKYNVDRLCSAIFDFDKGRQLSFVVSTQLSLLQKASIVGTKGSLQVQIPFNPTADKATTIYLNDGTNLDGSNIVNLTQPPCDHYQLECEAMNKAIRKEAKLPYSVDDAIENMQIIDALFKSIRTGKWVNLS